MSFAACDNTRFPEALGEFHDECIDGLVTICKRLIRNKYPDFDVRGFEVFSSSAPRIYIGEAGASSIGRQLCVQVGCNLKFSTTMTVINEVL
jgi:hypothetical protein